MSPLQLFVEGLGSSECKGPSPQPNSHSGPNAASEEITTDGVESVQVPSNKFVPCNQLSLNSSHQLILCPTVVTSEKAFTTNPYS